MVYVRITILHYIYGLLILIEITYYDQNIQLVGQEVQYQVTNQDFLLNT